MLFRDDEKPSRRSSRGAVSVALSDGKSRKTSTAAAMTAKSSVISSSTYGSKRASLAANAAAERIAPVRGRDIQVL